MKRDMDLVRQILLAIEQCGKDPRGLLDLNIAGYASEEVAYHVMILRDAGLIEATNLSSSSGFDYRPRSLTWAGHEFLDAARNDTVWNKTKEIVREKGGSIPFEVLKSLLMRAAMSLFGPG